MGFLGIGDDPAGAAKYSANKQAATQIEIAGIQAEAGKDKNLIQQEISEAANLVKLEELKIQKELGFAKIGVENDKNDITREQNKSAEKVKMMEIMANYAVAMDKNDIDRDYKGAKGRKIDAETYRTYAKVEADKAGYNDGNGGFLSGVTGSGNDTPSAPRVNDPNRNMPGSVRG